MERKVYKPLPHVDKWKTGGSFSAHRQHQSAFADKDMYDRPIYYRDQPQVHIYRHTLHQEDIEHMLESVSESVQVDWIDMSCFMDYETGDLSTLSETETLQSFEINTLNLINLGKCDVVVVFVFGRLATLNRSYIWGSQTCTWAQHACVTCRERIV